MTAGRAPGEKNWLGQKARHKRALDANRPWRDLFYDGQNRDDGMKRSHFIRKENNFHKESMTFVEANSHRKHLS